MGKVYKIVLLSILSLYLGVNSFDYYYFEDSNNEPVNNNNVHNCKLDQKLFLCQDNDTCIDIDKVCDGKSDCHDQSDENRKCKDSKFNCDSKNCPKESTCYLLPTGAECVCPTGYNYNSDHNTCEDTNECEIHGICSQGCMNTVGSYRCTCFSDDYRLKSDNKTCILKSSEALLLYSTQKTVVGIYLKSRHIYTVADNLTQAIGVAYDGQNIYWTNIQNEEESIVKAREDGSKQEILLTSGLDAPEDLAVDWLTGNIYFSDNILQHIAVCSNDGHYCMPLVVIDVHQPRGIALWPQMGLMYWTDWGLKPMIARASMDGADPKALIKTNIHWPNGITLDIPNERFYWVDAKLGTIESAKMDGSDRKLVLSDILKHPYGIAVFEDNLYWSDWDTKSIHTCHKFTGKDHEVVAKDSRIYAVHVYHPAKQPKVEHACTNRHCSHLCLLAAKNSSTCGCPDGSTLSADQTRCVKSTKKQKLYISFRNTILEMEHTTFGKHRILQEHMLPMFVHQMTYNTINGTIIVADNIQKVIREYDPISKESRNLVRGKFGNITGMAFDHLAQNLYWADSERHVVEVYSFGMNERAIVHFFSGVDSPVGIGLVPEDGKMFVALQSSKNIHIDLKTLGGHGDHTHVFEDIAGMGAIQIVPDHDTRTLYWVDTEGGRIEFSLLENLHSYPLRTGLPKPSSMALVDDDVFWTTLNSPYIFWTHKNNLGSVKKFLIEASSFKMADKIQLLSSYQTKMVDHSCLHNNGGCSHVCVSAGMNFGSCLCPSGLVFKDATNKTCIEALDCEFRCNSGECITTSRRCNGHKDCPDGSDEESCTNNEKKICAFDEFMCHNSKQCVSNEMRCNNNEDYNDGSDELNCEDFDKIKKCHKHQHACNNGRCIDVSSKCDGVDDCGDKSDETNCKENGDSKPVCGPNTFQCISGQCLAKSWECDGRADCVDGSDEHDKCAEQCTLDRHLFLCQDKMTCVALDTVCDGKANCPDGSDEDGQCFRTDICHENHCPKSSTCYPLPTNEKKTCVCPPGYNYDAQENTCNDIDECKTFGICSNQGCLNTEGSFTCLCDDNFKLDIDNKSCVIKEGESLLLYTAGEKVAGVFLKTHKKIIIDESPGQKLDVASDEKNSFWINNQTQEVVRALKNGSQQEVLITAELMGHSKEIEVDQLTGNIYFIDQKNKKIAVCSKDGQNCMLLFSFGEYQEVSNLVLNSKTRYMYWFELYTYRSRNYGEITRASMDGNKFPLFMTDLRNLQDITLDVHSGWLYWIDGQNRIEAVREDGSDRRVILQLSESSKPSSIAVFEDSIYWTEYFSRTINKANKFNGKNQRVILKEFANPHIGSVQVTYSLKQNNKDNSCKNNKCSHLCLIGPNNEIKCACPAGMILSRNKKQCIGSAKKQTLYLASDKTISEIEVTTSGHQRLLKKYKFPMPFDHLTYNPVGNMLYLYDPLSKQILEFNPSTNQTKTLVDRKLGNITGMTLDVKFQNLYWTDSELQTVEVYSLKSQKRAIFHSFPGVDVPIGLGVIEVYERGYSDSSYTKLLFAMQSPSKIYIITNIGDLDEYIIDEHFEDKSIFMVQDNQNEFIYVVDPIHGKVIASKLGKTLFYPVLPHLKEISSIGSTSKDVFWTTSTSSYIYWNYVGNMNIRTKIKIPISSFDLNSKNKIQIIPKECCSSESSPYERYDPDISVYSEGLRKMLCSSGYALSNENNRCLKISECGFRCDSGKCLTLGERCNGFIDCPENEDEEDCEEYEKRKNNTIYANGRNDMFKCLSGTFIPEKWKCDGAFDCPEGYDESDEICGVDVIVNVDKYKTEVNLIKPVVTINTSEDMIKSQLEGEFWTSLEPLLEGLNSSQKIKAKLEFLQVLNELKKLPHQQ